MINFLFERIAHFFFAPPLLLVPAELMFFVSANGISTGLVAFASGKPAKEHKFSYINNNLELKKCGRSINVKLTVAQCVNFST